MALLSMQLDDKAETTLEFLQHRLCLAGKVEVLHRAVQLLAVASDADDKGLRLALVDSRGAVVSTVGIEWGGADTNGGARK